MALKTLAQQQAELDMVAAIPEDNIRWLAGFFEGEGCIGFYIYNAETDHRGTSLRLSVTQKFRHSMDAVLECVSGLGRISEHKGHDVFSWVVQGRMAVAFILRMLPHMRMKHKIDQAMRALRAYAEHTNRLKRASLARKCKTKSGKVIWTSNCHRSGSHPHEVAN